MEYSLDRHNRKTLQMLKDAVAVDSQDDKRMCFFDTI